MSKPDTFVELSKTISLCEYKSGGHKGFWLYDETQGMNLSMCAKSETEAFVEALTYYQERLAKVESEYASMSAKVNTFVKQFVEDETDQD